MIKSVDINIKEFIGNIDVSDIGPIPSKRTPNKIIESLPNKTGVYTLKFINGYHYVGSSKKLKYRILQHLSNMYNIESISVYVTYSYIDAVILEYMLIKEFKSELNYESENYNKAIIIHGKRLYDGLTMYGIMKTLENEYNINISNYKDVIMFIGDDVPIISDNKEKIICAIVEIFSDMND